MCVLPGVYVAFKVKAYLPPSYECASTVNVKEDRRGSFKLENIELPAIAHPADAAPRGSGGASSDAQ